MKKQEICIEICEKKTKKQKKNMEETSIEAWKKKQAKRVLEKWNINFLYSIKMNKKSCDKVEVNKKEFCISKQPIALGSVLVNEIVVSHKFKYSDEGFNIL